MRGTAPHDMREETAASRGHRRPNAHRTDQRVSLARAEILRDALLPIVIR
jgi:hypothetical protein